MFDDLFHLVASLGHDYREEKSFPVMRPVSLPAIRRPDPTAIQSDVLRSVTFA
jgi:hypothetical protein